jgi:hypothetical protein
MSTPKPFPQAGFLLYLESVNASALGDDGAPLPPPLTRILCAQAGAKNPAHATINLIALLRARRATLEAAWTTQQVDDALRRYQKFAKPGQPSPHIVQLRQQQAAARLASSRAKRALIQTAAALVRDAGITVPARVALELFITQWIDANVPQDFAAPT